MRNLMLITVFPSIKNEAKPKKMFFEIYKYTKPIFLKTAAEVISRLEFSCCTAQMIET